MALFESGNPTLTEKMFNKGLELDAARQGIMTVRGTINKFGFMLVLLIASAAFNWHLFQEGKPATTQTLMMVGVFGGLIMAFAIIFKPGWAKYIAPPVCNFRRFVHRRHICFIQRNVCRKISRSYYAGRRVNLWCGHLCFSAV